MYVRLVAACGTTPQPWRRADIDNAAADTRAAAYCNAVSCDIVQKKETQQEYADVWSAASRS